MHDAGVEQESAVIVKSGSSVEAACVRLSVEMREAIPTVSSRERECVEQRATGARASRGALDGHAADLHGHRVDFVETTGADRHVAVANEGVERTRAGRVVRIDLFLARNVLLLDEDSRANREGRP